MSGHDDAGPAARPVGPEGRDRRRSRWRQAVPVTRLVVILGLIIVVVVVVAVVALVTGPPSKDDLLRQAGIIGKRELLIGVKDDQPGIALRDPRTGVYTGFDIDIGYLIASDLGFRPSDVRFLPIESEDRERRRAYDQESGKYVTVDMVIASYSITAERIAAGANFSVPYLRTEQSVLTLKDHAPVEALTDLADKQQVCTIATSTSASALEAAGIKRPKLEKKISACITGLADHRYDAVTTDAAILAGFAHQRRYRGLLKHHDVGLEAEENYGVNVGPNEALRLLVNLSLYHSWHDPDDRRWEDAYDRNLRPEQPDSNPQDVAVDQQPRLDRPAVREWPWQR